MSHPYLTPDAERESHLFQSTREIRGRADHVVDVLHVCHPIVVIRRASIGGGQFLKGIHGNAIMEAMIADARNALQYKVQRRNQEVRFTCS